MPVEQWKTVVGYPDYEVSDRGRVVSFRRGPRGHLMSPDPHTQGYPKLKLYSPDGNKKVLKVHRLVAMAFLGAPAAGMVTRHLNGDVTDNRLENLAWGTQLENAADMLRHGTCHQKNKTHCPQGHPYSGPNLWVSPNGRQRHCRACRADRDVAKALRAAGLAVAA